MKAFLIAAALAVPVVANAEDTNRYGVDSPKRANPGSTTTTTPGSDTPGNLPSSAQPGDTEAGMPTQSGARTDSQVGINDDAFSKDKVVQKINKIGQKHVELGNLAKARASSDDVRRFGNKLVKDSESLAKTVQTYAKENKITLSAAPYQSGSTAPKPSGDVSGSGAMGGTGTDDTLAGNDTSMGTPPIPGNADTDKYGQTGAQPKEEDFQEKLSQLRNLQGTEFDSQFLSNVIDGSERALTKLNGWKGQGDRGLDRLIDRAVKMVGDHQKEALRLQGKIPAA